MFHTLQSEKNMFENLSNTLKTFHDSMLHQSIAALKLNRHFDNFDEARFNYDGVDRSKEFNTGTFLSTPMQVQPVQ
jgi:hypothetical protein